MVCVWEGGEGGGGRGGLPWPVNVPLVPEEEEEDARLGVCCALAGAASVDDDDDAFGDAWFGVCPLAGAASVVVEDEVELWCAFGALARALMAGAAGGAGADEPELEPEPASQSSSSPSWSWSSLAARTGTTRGAGSAALATRRPPAASWTSRRPCGTARVSVERAREERMRHLLMDEEGMATVEQRG